MIEYIREQIRGESDLRRARLLMREYLQARILEAIQGAGAFASWCFIGGTALRFLYRLPRFSEDLDFSLSRGFSEEEGEPFIEGFVRVVDRTVSTFGKEGYTVQPKISDSRVGKTAFLKFHGLLYELGLSPHSGELVSIRVEIDSDPPDGAKLETTVLRRHSLLNVQHYDRSSLFAGKLHALLSRDYTKGRDIYDLLWYLSDPQWPAPNITFLRNALEQTGWNGPEVTAENWARLVSEQLEAIDWERAVEDVRPFLEKPEEAYLLTRGNLSKLLSRFR